MFAARLRSEQGFGMIELVISLMVLNVGILAVMGAFNSGALAVSRASQVSSATVLADTQMEKFRALNWSAISLNATAVGTACAAGSPYAALQTPCATQVTSSCSAGVAQCNPLQPSVVGPDSRRYRIDTYVVNQTPDPAGRAVKFVRVVVRQAATLQVLARLSSTFDQATGF